MNTAEKIRVANPEILKILANYRHAVDTQDFDAIEDCFAETAVYLSDGVGALEGRDNIIRAFRSYFAGFRSHVSADKTIEIVSDRALRATWTLDAEKKSGEKNVRSGEELIFLDTDGLIQKVIVRDNAG